MPRREGESIYRQVAVRMHGDEKVRKLSRPGPSGKGLWYELLIGEQTGIIPGLSKIGEAAFAEQLDWDLEGFRKAFKEVSDQGMVKADWKARLVFVPKAIQYNKPASPNVILHWRAAWDLLPECKLKVEAWSQLRAFTEGCGESWSKAFDKACPKPHGKASANQVTGNREQKEEEKKPPAPPPGTAQPVDDPEDPDVSPAQRLCRRAIAERFAGEFSAQSGGQPFRWSPKDRAGVIALANAGGNGGADPAEGLRLLGIFIERKSGDPYYAKNFNPAFIASVINALRLPPTQGNGQRKGFTPLTGTKERFENYDDGDPLGLNLKPKEPPRG